MSVRSLPLRSLLLAAGLWLAAVCAGAAELDLGTPLPVDPNIEMGVLPNGVRYWVRSHKTPPGKVSAWLHIGSGSINENENQRGLAHYLEHLAFNGSENFPAGTLVKYFESIGLRFGHDQNAFTSFDQTTYQISLPDPKAETVGRGLQFLADVGFRMSLLPEEIDKERNVILEEARARKGVNQRIMDKLWPILLPGSRIAERQPIGKEEVIKAADQKVIADYYAKWYRPDIATVLLAGDIPVADAAKLIAENFGAWKDNPVKAPALDPGIKMYTTQRAAVVTDPELTETDVSAMNIAPAVKRLTAGDLRQELVENMGSWIVSRRLSALIEKGSAPYQRANTGVMPVFFSVCKLTEAQATGKPESWEAMLTALLAEVKRGREFGFLEQELADAKAQMLASAEQSARTESTWDARAFLGRMNNAVTQDQKPMSEAQRLELLRALVPGITLQEVHAAFKRNFAPETRLLLVQMPGKAGLKQPSEQEILAAAARAEAAPVEALAATKRPKSLLEQEPQAGAVAVSEEEPDLKVLSATLSNGVRVHLRSMDFKKDQVLAQINIGGGAIRETAANRGISEAAALAFEQAAAGKLSSTLIREMMTGKNVSVGGGAGEDTFTLNVKGSPADLEDGFRLAHLLLTQARIEPSALKVWKEETLQKLEELKTSAESQASLRIRTLLMNNDPRSRVLTPAEVQGLTLESAQQWLDETLRAGPVEVSIVGDLPRERALELALKYFGSLPARKSSGGTLENLRKTAPAKGPLEDRLEIETLAPRAVVQCGWRGADWKNVKERRVLQLAALMLNTRLREEIREARGLTYSIYCFAQPARVYEGSGFFGAYFTADPAKADEVCKLAMAVISKFAEEGPSEKEMETVRKQIKNDLETTLKEPSYWNGVLGDLDYHGTKLSDVKELAEKMQSYTREDVMNTVRKYVREEGRVQVIALPKKK